VTVRLRHQSALQVVRFFSSIDDGQDESGSGIASPSASSPARSPETLARTTSQIQMQLFHLQIQQQQLQQQQQVLLQKQRSRNTFTTPGDDETQQPKSLQRQRSRSLNFEPQLTPKSSQGEIPKPTLKNSLSTHLENPEKK